MSTNSWNTLQNPVESLSRTSLSVCVRLYKKSVNRSAWNTLMTCSTWTCSREHTHSQQLNTHQRNRTTNTDADFWRAINAFGRNRRDARITIAAQNGTRSTELHRARIPTHTQKHSSLDNPDTLVYPKPFPSRQKNPPLRTSYSRLKKKPSQLQLHFFFRNSTRTATVTRCGRGLESGSGEKGHKRRDTDADGVNLLPLDFCSRFSHFLSIMKDQVCVKSVECQRSTICSSKRLQLTPRAGRKTQTLGVLQGANEVPA